MLKRRRKPWDLEYKESNFDLFDCSSLQHWSVFIHCKCFFCFVLFILHKCAESIVRRIETCLFFLFFPDSKASSQSFRHLSAAIYWLLPFCDWCLYTPCKYQSATILGTPYWYWVAPSSAPFHLGREIRTKGEKCLKMTHWTRELLKDT